MYLILNKIKVTRRTGHGVVRFIKKFLLILFMVLATEKHTSTGSCVQKTESDNRNLNSGRSNLCNSECRILFNKAFFGKTSCLKVTQNTLGEVYFHFGLEKEKTWTWKKVKFSDAELADIIFVLKNKKSSVSFFHNFKDDKTQIWITRKDDSVNFKTKHSSRTLIGGEIYVLELLLKHFIIRSSAI